MTKIAMVVGEASGDVLGASLARALHERIPDLEITGIAGPLMLAENCQTLFPMDKLSVMGLAEVLGHLPELLGIRRQLLAALSADPPDAYIGIDAPDFNLPVEKKLAAQGIPAIHYVCPSVWAWRQGRVAEMSGFLDRVLTLFPFEAELFAPYGDVARFVGHPSADATPDEPDRLSARQAIGLEEDGPVVAILPGSRRGEINRLAGLFMDVALVLSRLVPGVRFVMPAANPGIAGQLETEIVASGLERITILDGQAHQAMTAADVVLLASGTAALEALLLQRPMVVSYRISPLTLALVKALRLLKIRHYSLPNVLAGREIVPEFMQKDARPEKIAAAVQALLQDNFAREAQLAEFKRIRRQLKQDAAARAADEVVEVLRQRGKLTAQ